MRKVPNIYTPDEILILRLISRKNDKKTQSVLGYNIGSGVIEAQRSLITINF